MAEHATVAVKGLAVVLFGMPAAGKSSLLGALAQAAQTQAGLLGGHLKDESGGLAELQQRLYRDRGQETLDEVVPYPVTFQPSGKGARPVHATLIDCDGRVAHSYLTGQRALGATTGQVELGRAIQGADTLLLVVDVSAEPDQLKRDFAQFTKFLRALEAQRGRSAEVGGLPVYIVLTKCDLLVRPKDTTSQWVQRIEEGKRKIGQRFKDFLASEAQREERPFGRIALHVWATAVKRPELADKPERPTEPFGVAELFRQCFASGQAFQELRGKAERRLQYVFAGIVGLLAILLMSGAFFFLSRPASNLSTLKDRASAALGAEEGTPAERLKGNNEEAAKKLKMILDDPEFKELPQLVRLKLETRYEEARQYAARQSLFESHKREPEDFGKEDVFVAYEKFLVAFEVLPNWDKTPLGLELKERLKTVEVFRQRVGEVEKWYQDRIREGELVLEAKKKVYDSSKLVPAKDFLKAVAKWESEARNYLKKWAEETKPFADAHALEGFPKIGYRQIYLWNSVQELQKQWEERKGLLKMELE